MPEETKGFNPKIVSLNYRKNSGVVPNVSVRIIPEIPYSSGSSLEVIQKPNWLAVILDDLEEADGYVNKVAYSIAINPQYANNLAAGLHSAEVKVRGKIRIGPIPGTLTYTLKVNLRILEYTPLSISPGILSFSFTRGGNIPPGEFLRISTNNNWSISGNQSWLSFSQNNGQGNTTISLNADPAGMPNGLHLATFIVSDGDTEKTGSAYLVIRGTGDEADYLNVNPKILTFSENYGEPSTKDAQFTVDASVNSSLTTNVNWLSLETANIQAGINSVKVNTQNTDVLEVGSYPAQIEISGEGFGVEIIEILLTVVSEEISGIESNALYFADDRVTLQLTSADANAEAIIDFNTKGTLENSRYRKKAPFYRNAASIIIGQETDILLVPSPVPEMASQVFNPVSPIAMDFSVYDKQMGNAAMYLRESYTNVKFLNGTSPENNVLTKLPEEITVPADGVVCFSFLQEESINEAAISGDYTGSIPVNQAGTVITFFLELSDLELQPKNKIQISCGPVQLSVRIKPTEMPSTYLIWQNEWDCPEVFNCDGVLTIQGERDNKIVVNNRAGKDYSSIIDIKRPKSFSIGTGNIYSEAETEFLAGILDSRRVWLESAGKRWEIIPDFRSLTTSETRRAIRNFTLDFNSAVK